MTEVAVSVAAKVAEYLVAPITLPFRYLWNYKSNVENLASEVKKLEGRREMVQHSIEDARRKGEEIETHVDTWLDSVKNIIDEAWELINDDKHQQGNLKGCKCFSCTDLKKRYRHSKKAAKLKADVVVQEEAGKFEKVSFHTVAEETWLQSSDGYEAFDARKSILMNIIEAFRNPDINVVGIYGMGGIGKTTLAKEVAREAKKDKLFRLIVFVEVSQTPDIKKIQQEIADKLGLEFHVESISGRARILSERLKKEEKILLILDNIWGSVNFEIVGIPFRNDHKGLKLLLTTRSKDILTNKMDCQRNFGIESLNEADAQSLFKSIAGSCIDRAEVQLDVAKECGGVPLAIVTIAKALRNKEIYEWNNALQELRNPSSKRFEGDTKEVYTSIKLSYNHLESEELKETFLLCSSMGCTYDASFQDLLRYGIGMGLFRDINTMAHALDKVHTLISKLKASSLLLDAPARERFGMHAIPNSKRFAMHDVVCAVARSITTTNHQGFAVIDGAFPQNRFRENTLKNCTAITLHDVGKLPRDLELVCPQLKFLYMKPKDSYLKISDNFFVGMLRLQVLHLMEMDLWPLPTSFSCLITLQTLCLDQCKLKDIAIIGDLKKLKVLSFRGSEIEELPAEMHQLTMLRLLDLSYCSKLRVISPLVMSGLTHLEFLYMKNTSTFEWDVARPNTERRNASLDDLKHLTDLTTLEIRLPDAKMSNGLLFPKLERYKILIGDKWVDWHSQYRTSRIVKLCRCNNIEDGFISQLKGFSELELCDVPGVRNVLYDLDRSGFPKLKHLTVTYNPDSLYIVDSKHSISCNALESLHLSRLDKLENICNGPLGVKSFDQLRIIKISFCNNLPNIFSFSTTQVLSQLEEIKVCSCQNMKEIFAIGGQDYVNDNEATCALSLRQLCTVTLEYLPRFESFCSEVKIASPLQLTNDSKSREIISEDELDVVRTLFNERVVFPNLKTLKIHSIYVEKIWHNKFPAVASWVQNLTHLIVIGCSYLKELFSSSMVNCFVQLQHLEISRCELLEEMVVMEVLRGVKRRDTMSFPQLNCLKLENLPKLKRLYAGNYLEIPLLKEFEMVNCPEFNECIFDHKVGFPTLEKIKLFGIHNLKMIWHSQLAEDSFSKLKSLKVYYCQNLLSVFPSSMCGRLLRLESLDVDECGSLEEIFGLQQIHYKERHSIATTQLRELRIISLPNLKYVWNKDPQKMLSFGNLQKVEASGCQSLKNLFPGSIGRTLSELEYLSVSDCGLEEIVAKEGVLVEEEPTSFLFPKLTFLELRNLPELVTFHSGGHTIEWPVLKKLKLRHCGKLKIFTSEVIRIQDTNYSDKAFPCLEELELVGEKVAMWQGQILQCLFPELKILKVENDESTGLPLGIIKRFHNLEMLSLTTISCKEIFSYEDVETQEGTTLEVKILVLQGLDNLEYMWKEDFKLDLILQNLEVLKVTRCGSLISLVPPSASFQNLANLEVNFCDGLINFMTSSTAKSLVHLTKIQILGCENMTEVVGNQPGDVMEDKIVFSKLKSLSLCWLPSLTSFCLGNHILEFPSLEELIVQACPNMKIFFQGVLSTQALQKVEIDCKWIELSADVALNKALQQCHEKVSRKMSTEPEISSSSSESTSSHGLESDELIDPESFDSELVELTVAVEPNEVGESSTPANIASESIANRGGASGPPRAVSKDRLNSSPTHILFKDYPNKLGSNQLMSIRNTYKIPEGVSLRLPSGEERADWNFPGWTVFYECPFEWGFRFPVLGLARRVLCFYNMAPSQLMPNSWRICLAVDHICETRDLKFDLENLLYNYYLKENEKDMGGRFSFVVRRGRRNLVEDLSTNDRGWKNKYFLAKGDLISDTFQGFQIPSLWNPSVDTKKYKLPEQDHISEERIDLIHSIPLEERNVKVLLQGKTIVGSFLWWFIDREEDIMSTPVQTSIFDSGGVAKRLKELKKQAKPTSSGAGAIVPASSKKSPTKKQVSTAIKGKGVASSKKRGRSDDIDTVETEAREEITFSFPFDASVSSNQQLVIDEAKKFLFPQDVDRLEGRPLSDIFDEGVNFHVQGLMHYLFMRKQAQNAQDRMKEAENENNKYKGHVEAYKKEAFNAKQVASVLKSKLTILEQRVKELEEGKKAAEEELQEARAALNAMAIENQMITDKTVIKPT